MSEIFVPKVVVPKVVAHRGDSATYPENTHLALQKALMVGAAGVEFDVHLSQDHVPIVIHDRKLQRTTGENGSVFDLSAKEIIQYSAGYAQRFGGKFPDEKIPSLETIVALLLEWPDRLPFVELKRSSLSHFGVDIVLDSVLAVLEPLNDHFVLISYNQHALASARERGVKQIGWVFDRPTDEAFHIAQQLKPEYLVSDADEVTDTKTPLWPGVWDWMLFEVNDPQRALDLASQGVHSIETNKVVTYCQHADFSDCRVF